jgi:hypothetical protein
VLLANKPPHILPLRRTCLPREKAGQVSGYFERSRRTSRDAGSNPYDPDPIIHTQRVALRVDVFRFSQGCAIAYYPSLLPPPQALPRLEHPILGYPLGFVFTQFVVRCASDGHTELVLPWSNCEWARLR